MERRRPWGDILKTVPPGPLPGVGNPPGKLIWKDRCQALLIRYALTWSLPLSGPLLVGGRLERPSTRRGKSGRRIEQAASTMNHSDIRGSEPHDRVSSGAASVFQRGSPGSSSPAPQSFHEGSPFVPASIRSPHGFLCTCPPAPQAALRAHAVCVMTAQMKPVSSRATAATATEGRLPRASSR